MACVSGGLGHVHITVGRIRSGGGVFSPKNVVTISIIKRVVPPLRRARICNPERTDSAPRTADNHSPPGMNARYDDNAAAAVHATIARVFVCCCGIYTPCTLYTILYIHAAAFTCTILCFIMRVYRVIL